jgi:PKD repeat protein
LLAFVLLFAPVSGQISGNTAPCSRSTAYYNVPGADVIMWNVTGSNPYIHRSNDVLEVIWQSVGTYIVTSVYALSPGVYDTATITVNVRALPAPQILSLNFQGCVTQNVRGDLVSSGREIATVKDNLTCYTSCDSGWYKYVVKGDSGSTFTWSSAHGAIIDSSRGDTVLVRWIGAGYTTLVVTETNVSGCSDSAEICVNIIANPSACFTSVPADSAGIIRLCRNSTLVLNDACTVAPYGSTLSGNTWVFGDGTVVYNKSIVEHAFAAAGTYQIKLAVNSNCNCVDTITRTVIVDDATGPDIYCVNAVCHDSISTFTTSDTCSILTWNVLGGTALTTLSNDSITVKWGSGNSGYGVIELTSACGSSCPYPTQAYVPILPQNAIINGDTIVCNGSTELYSVPFVPTTIYTWRRDGSILSPTSNEISILWSLSSGITLPDHGHSVQVNYQNPFLGCSGSSTLGVTISIPLVVSGDTVICTNQVAQYYATYPGNFVNSNWVLYALNTGDTVSTATGISASFSGLGAGFYELYTYPDTGYFCSTPVITRLRVIQAPTAPMQDIIGPDTVCANTLVSYATSAAQPGYYLEWSALTGTPSTGTGQYFNTIWSSSFPALIRLRQVMIGGAGCASSWKTDTILRNNIIVPDIAGDTVVCSDEIVSYALNIDAGFYSWSVTDATKGSIRAGQYSNTVSIQWNYTDATDNADLTVEVHVCDTVIYRTIHITITGVPAVVIQADTAPFCVYEAVNFSANVTGSSFLWDFGDGNTATVSNPVHSYMADGTYPVTVQVSNPNGCNATVTGATTVSMLPQPVAIFTTPQPTEYCSPEGWADSLFVTLQNMNGGSFTFQLYRNDTAQGAPGSNSIYVVTIAGEYKVKVTSLITGCWGYTNPIVITDSCTPACVTDATINFTHSYNCGKLWVDAVYTSPPVTFVSFNFGEPGSTSNVATTDTASHVYTDAGYYTVMVTGLAADTSGADTCVINQRINIHIPLVPHLSTQYQCRNDSLFTYLIDVSTYVGNPITSWHWVVDGSTVATTQNPELYLSTGTHVVTLHVSSSADTCQITDTITVPAKAVASYLSADSVCETQAVHFTSTSTGNIVSYLWDYSDGSFSALQNSDKVFECNTTLGDICFRTIVFTVTDVYGCISNISQAQVVYDYKFLTNKPLSILPESSSLCFGNDTLAKAVIKGSPGTGPYSFVWNDGVSGMTGIDTITRTLNTTGSYSITVTDKYGCQANVSAANAYFESVTTSIKGDTVICQNQRVNLNMFNGHNYTYTWLFKRATDTVYHVGSYAPSYVFNPIMIPALDLAQVIGIITSPAGCSDTVGPVTLHMLPVNTPTITFTYEPSLPCVNEGPVTAVAHSPTPGYFIWGNGVISDTMVFTAGGIYQVILVDTNGCKYPEREFYVQNGPDFSQLITGCYTRCITDITKLYGPSAPSGHTYTYQWILNDSAVISTLQTPTVTISGTYNLVIRDSVSGYGFVCPDTSEPIYLEILPCTNPWCISALDSMPCATCYFDAENGKRIISLALTFTYTSTGPATFTVYSGTDNVVLYYNTNPLFQTSTLLHSVGMGVNIVHIDLEDTSPFNSTHNVVIDIEGCQFEVNIETPASCTGMD